MKTNLIGRIFFVCSAVFFGNMLTEAAELQQTIQAETKMVASFDAKAKTFVFGQKQVVFADNGTFKVISSGRCIATSHFFISTDFQGSQSNLSVTRVTPGEYTGGTLYVESCTVDENARAITVEGKLPFHKKGTPVQLGSWKQVAKLTDDGKLDVTLDFVLPEGQAIGRTQGVMLKFPTATGYTYGAKEEKAVFSAEQKAICVFTGPAIKPIYADKADCCAWEFPEKKINYLFFHRNSDHGLFFTPHGGKTNFCHVVFNPL